MTTQQDCTGIPDPIWDDTTLRTALFTAGHAARKGAHRLSLSPADRDDLRQDILVVLIQRSRHFDPSRSAWPTFAALLARHVVADRARLERQSEAPVFVPLEVDDFPAGCSITCQEGGDPIVSLDLQRVVDELPPAPRGILHLVGAAGGVADAQRASSQPCASFYRSLADLRLWLRASGMGPAGGPPGRRMRATP